MCVDVYLVEPVGDGDMPVLRVLEESGDLAGPERWRWTVWGSGTVRELGARFFSVLADEDLYVGPDQVGDFLHECALLAGSLEEIAAGGNVSVRVLGERLRSIEDAARRAHEAGGGVLIW